MLVTGAARGLGREIAVQLAARGCRLGIADINAAGLAETAATASHAGSGLVLVEPEAGQSVDDAIEALAEDPNVEFAEPDLKVSLALTPNDPYYACPAPPAAQTCQWHYPQINLPAAWDTTTGNTGRPAGPVPGKPGRGDCDGCGVTRSPGHGRR